MGNTIGSMDIMDILNDEMQFGKHVSLMLKLVRYVKGNEVKKLRTILSGYGKSRRGFDVVDPILKAEAFEIMKRNGYAPYVKGYRTPSFTIVKVDNYRK